MFSSTSLRSSHRNLAVVLASASIAALGLGGGAVAFSGGADSSSTETTASTPADRKLHRVVPQAQPSTPVVQTQGPARPETMDQFLTDVIQNVDGFWTRTLTGAGLAEPTVIYNWLSPGASAQMACTQEDGSPEVTNDETAAYCPADDTIYVSQQFAYDLWLGDGVDRSTAAGDFGVAYAVAHEYAHNVQHELGLFEARPDLPVKQFELQADCLAGVWANSAYHDGLLESGDVEEAMATSFAAGDFDTHNPGHHGTPDERQQAWALGYNNGSADDCGAYVPLS